MKKLLLTLGCALLLFTGLFAQEEISVSGKKSGDLGLRTGVFGEFFIPMGDLGDFVAFDIGAGVDVELDLPISLGNKIKIGVPLIVGYNLDVTNNDLLSSMWNVQVASGIYARIIFADGAFVLQPELNYGITLYFPTANSDYENTLQSSYLDQLLLLAINFRFAPKSVMNGKLEFSVAPLYSLGVESGSVVNTAGARFGVLYKIM